MQLAHTLHASRHRRDRSSRRQRQPRLSPSPSSSSNDVVNTWCHELSSAVATICDSLTTHWIPEYIPIVASSSSVCRIVSRIYRFAPSKFTHDSIPFFFLPLAYTVCLHFEDKHYSLFNSKSQKSRRITTR